MVTAYAALVLTVADHIKAQRKRLHLSQRNLANLLGHKSLTTVQSWERGTRTPKASNVRALAAAFGVAPRDLLVNVVHGYDELRTEQQPVAGATTLADLPHVAKNRREKRLLDLSREIERKNPADLPVLMEMVASFARKPASESRPPPPGNHVERVTVARKLRPPK